MAERPAANRATQSAPAAIFPSGETQMSNSPCNQAHMSEVEATHEGTKERSLRNKKHCHTATPLVVFPLKRRPRCETMRDPSTAGKLKQFPTNLTSSGSERRPKPQAWAILAGGSVPDCMRRIERRTPLQPWQNQMGSFRSLLN